MGAHLAAGSAVVALLAGAVTGSESSGVRAFVRDHALTSHRTAVVDLNGDGRPEALVYADGRDDCGSGGCELYILALSPTGYRQVANVAISRPPVRVLSSSSHGWRDLSVRVAGGGVTAAYDARLRFDGRTYPSNPSVPPATPLENGAGRIVIRAEPG